MQHVILQPMEDVQCPAGACKAYCREGGIFVNSAPLGNAPGLWWDRSMIRSCVHDGLSLCDDHKSFWNDTQANTAVRKAGGDAVTIAFKGDQARL